MSFFVYMLRCRDGSFYVGHTEDLERRVRAHELGLASKWTSFRLPITLVWHEAMETREEALSAERQIKGWSRAKKEALVRGEWSVIQTLAKPKYRAADHLVTETNQSGS